MTRLLHRLGFHDRCRVSWTRLDGRDLLTCLTDHREGDEGNSPTRGTHALPVPAHS